MVLPSTATTARNNRIRKPTALLRRLCCNNRSSSCCTCCCSDEKGGGVDRQRQWRQRRVLSPEKRQFFSNSTKSFKKNVKFTRDITIVCIVALSLGLFWVYRVNKIEAEQQQQQQQHHQVIPIRFNFFQNDGHYSRHARTPPPPPPPQFAIFYNIFIPNDKAGIQHALKIVKEQVEQVKKSSAVVSDNSVSRTILYYNTIGHLPNALQETHMQHDICGSQLSCRHMKHYEQATEAVTLQNLYDYCHEQQQQQQVDYHNTTTLQPTDDDIRVIYLHSKGSYHKNAVNEKWRRYLTMAATHHDCLFPFSSSAASSSSSSSSTTNNKNVSSCDVCGLHFFTEWTLFYPGNMFSAKCAYIRQLLPPNQFEQAMERAIGEALWMRLQGNSIQMKVFPDDRLDRYGLDRYATEHWVGSHPNLVRPCDVAPTEIPYRHWFTKSIDISTEQLHGALAPRYKGAPADNIAPNITLFWEQENNKLGNGKSARIREYFYLAGHLIKWYSLYDQAPPMDSYVWDWFPDGAAWKRAVQEYGPLAVQVMTSSAATDGTGNSSAVPNTPQQPAALFVDRTSSSSIFATRPLSFMAIFFQIYRRRPMNITEQMQIIVESVEATAAAELADTGSAVLYYQILGPTGPSPSKLNADEVQLLSRLCSETTVLECVELPSHSAEYEGETIQHLHDYCMMANDDDDTAKKRVVYLHNNFQDDDRYSSSLLWQTAAEAAMGIPCYQSISKEADNINKCNLCGYQFNTWSEFHMAENMWTAPCSYIHRLVSPKDYVALRQEVAKRAMVLKAKNRLTMTFFHGETIRETLGVDRYALPYWVASHPTVEPCDVVSSSSSSLGSTTDHGQGVQWFWTSEKLLSSTNVASTSKLHLLRRKQGPGESNEDAMTLDTMIRNDIGLRTREWCFFAGHVLRWGEIYNETTPPDTSWIWNYQQALLPDAHEWLAAIHQYGYYGAVDFMTRPFANTKV